MENKLKEDLKEIVERHEEVCSHLIGGFEYKKLVAELRELLNKNNCSR